MHLTIDTMTIEPGRIGEALNFGKRNGVLKRDVAAALDVTPTQLLNLAKGNQRTITLSQVQTIQELTGFQILPDFFLA